MIRILPSARGVLLEADDGVVAVPLFLPLSEADAQSLAAELLASVGTPSPEPPFDGD